MRVISHVSVGYAIVMKYQKTLRKTAAACLLEVREMNLRGRRYARGSITYIHVFPTTALIAGISVFLPARLVRDAD